MSRLLLWCSVAVGGTLFAVGACFSDRQSITEPVADPACRIPMTSPIFGSTRALVAIRGFSFRPDTVRIRPGTEVTWVNCEPETVDAHTSTSEDELWNSPFLEPGESYTRTFSAAGAFDYFCAPHPFMRGVVIVE